MQLVMHGCAVLASPSSSEEMCAGILGQLNLPDEAAGHVVTSVDYQYDKSHGV